MFLEHFRLNVQPFGVTPDPRFLFLGPQHREALATLVYGAESSRGFVALIARPGMGKTTLIFQFLKSLRHKARTAFLFQTDCNHREFLQYILTDLGLDPTGKDLPAMREMLNRVLLEEMRAGRRFVLVIDEAQNLEEKVLESVRLLSNFETPWTKLMQIVIAGQPQLAERLAMPSLAQLRQRISMVVRLKPFTREEAAEYISHRLRVAGYEGKNLFTAGAQLLIAEYSDGIPRNINNICFNAMSLACAMRRKTIDRDLITEVTNDLDLGMASHGELRQNARKEPKERRLKLPSRVTRNWSLHKWLPGLVAASTLVFPFSWAVSGNHHILDSLRSSRQVSDSVRGEENSSTQEPVAFRKEQESQRKIQQRLDGTRSITVLPGQTLYRIAIENIGVYNDAVFQELREHNPWLTNPHDVKAGQLIILPSDRRRSHTKLPIVGQTVDSNTADLEKQ